MVVNVQAGNKSSGVLYYWLLHDINIIEGGYSLRFVELD
jgi:hypothetical protein